MRQQYKCAKVTRKNFIFWEHPEFQEIQDNLSISGHFRTRENICLLRTSKQQYVSIQIKGAYHVQINLIYVHTVHGRHQ